jgi:ATP-dependent exoDNAse (exonuclease V) alpha subunit
VKVLASLSLDRHLTYVAMTRHREDLGSLLWPALLRQGGRPVSLLSRKNAKETTLDYAKSPFYRRRSALPKRAVSTS